MVVQALQRRQPEVLDALLQAHGREIQAVAYLILRDRADAEDVVVETLIAALEHGRELRDADALRAWLLRIATNKALGMRRRTVRIVRLDPALEIAAASHESGSVARTALLHGLSELPPKMRAAIVLRYYADLTVDECAQALGKSPNTIKAQLQEGLDRLRVHLAESGRDARKPVEARGA